MIIEYGHIYYEDILNKKLPEDEIKKSINLALEYMKNLPYEKFETVVLLDDKNYDLNESEKKELIMFISNYYELLGLKPDYIYFEKVFYNDVERIYSNIAKNNLKLEYFKKEDKYVEFLQTANYKIPLKKIKDTKITYSCQMLASLWTLMKSEMYKEKQIVTVLNKKYHLVEMHILDLLKHSGYSINNIHLWY
jgi:hypothetical protein